MKLSDIFKKSKKNNTKNLKNVEKIDKKLLSKLTGGAGGGAEDIVLFKKGSGGTAVVRDNQ